MVYCWKCGTENDDDAEFCKKCGTSLKAPGKGSDQEWDKRCEEECSGRKGSRGWTIFWGLVVILIGVWIIFEIVLKNLSNEIPELNWVNTITFPFWYLILAIIGIIIIITGIRIISRRD